MDACDSAEIGGSSPQRRAERALFYLGPDGGRRMILPAGPAEDAQVPVRTGYSHTDYEQQVRPRPVRWSASIVLVVLFAAACLAATWMWMRIWSYWQ